MRNLNFQVSFHIIQGIPIGLIEIKFPFHTLQLMPIDKRINSVEAHFVKIEKTFLEVRGRHWLQITGYK